MIAQGDKPQETVRLVGADAVSAGLEVREGFDRAWRRVGLALDRGGFTVEDRDRSKGIYFVRYIDPEVAGGDKRGLLNRWFGIGSGDKGSAQQYQVVVQAKGDDSIVMVRSKDGQVLSVDVDLQTARKILALLQDQLKQ
jgi:outer membrane protein assembly factor BamC